MSVPLGRGRAALRVVGAILCVAAVACTSRPEVSSRQARASVCVHLTGMGADLVAGPSGPLPLVDALRADVELLRSAGEEELAGDLEELIGELDEDRLAIAVYLEDTATSEERESIQAALEGVPGIADVTFEDRDEAAERFRELFADQPEFLEAVPVSALPESWRATVRAADFHSTLGDELGRLDGVRQVTIVPKGMDAFASEAFRRGPTFCDER